MSYEQFVALLRRTDVRAIIDVRSAPYSRHFPHFNRKALRDELNHDKIEYWFVGGKLGGRPNDKKFYCDGVADYEKMAQSDDFKHGLDVVVASAKKRRVAMMCSEQDPLDCHRCLLIGRALAKRGVQVKHIHADGSILSQGEIEERLLEMEREQRSDLFKSREERLAIAYLNRARKVAYAEPSSDSSGHIAAE